MTTALGVKDRVTPAGQGVNSEMSNVDSAEIVGVFQQGCSRSTLRGAVRLPITGTKRGCVSSPMELSDHRRKDA